jgi:hypothetical protein
VTIPIAAQATSSHILHVIRSTLLTVLVIDETHLEFVLQLIEGTSVKHIIVITNSQEEEDYKDRSKYFGVAIHGLRQVQKLGQQQDITIDRSNHISKYKICAQSDRN